MQGAGATHIFYGTSAESNKRKELLHAGLDIFTGTSESDARFGESVLTIEGEILIGSAGAAVDGLTLVSLLLIFQILIISHLT